MVHEDDRDALGTTRSRLLLLMCRGPRTVNELAEGLGLTDNAVRAQLAHLQSEGLVRPVGLRPGLRKPHVDYELTPKARRSFPGAHEPVLSTLLEVLHERLDPAQGRGLMKETARRLLAAWVGELVEGNPRGRAGELVEKLRELAPGVSLEEVQGRLHLRACGCPLASVTESHPEVCGVLAEVLSELLGSTVGVCCDREESPRCCFELGNPVAEDPTGR
jgi:predicted ArsR family transcriptional regulator